MNILLTSAGRRTYLVQYFKEALKGLGSVHASNSIYTYTLSQADQYVLTPNIYDDKYVNFLIDYCLKNDISVIISLFDIDLPVLAKNRNLFEQHRINVVVSDYRVTSICNDKWLTYNFLKDIGIKQPSSFIDLETARFALKSGAVRYPIFIKPRWGMGSIGIYRVETDNELEVFYSKLHRDIFKTYLKYESEAEKDACIIIQEAIRGQEYGIEVVNDLKGTYVATMAKKKLAMRSGETDVAEIVDSSIFVPVGKLISKNLKHVANLDIDCFVSENGDIYVLELNCRFGGQYPFSHLAGANVPLQIVRWLQGQPTDMSLFQPKKGLRACKEISPVIMSLL